VWFWRAEAVGFVELRDSLEDFVYSNRGHVGNGYYKNLPPGFSHIGIWEPQSPNGLWQAGRAFDTVVAPRELLENRIAEKNARVAEYRLLAPEVWLLIININDQFLGPGEVYPRPERLAAWKFLLILARSFCFHASWRRRRSNRNSACDRPLNSLMFSVVGPVLLYCDALSSYKLRTWRAII
jgi:hypothetical protein